VQKSVFLKGDQLHIRFFELIFPCDVPLFQFFNGLSHVQNAIEVGRYCSVWCAKMRAGEAVSTDSRTCFNK
jgi:hypothetical protein